MPSKVNYACMKMKKFCFLVPVGQQGIVRCIDGNSVQEAANKLHGLLKCTWAIPVDANGKQIGDKIDF